MMEYEQYERDEEFKALGQTALANLNAILAEHSAVNVAQLARHAYKYTDCGASVGALLYGGEDNPGKWVYGSDLHKLTAQDFITALSISSIVEGVDQCTETFIVDLLDENFETPQHAVEAYNDGLETIEDQAESIWQATHGCPTCAKHFGNCGEYGPVEGDDGMTPVWEDCPDCKGYGTSF